MPAIAVVLAGGVGTRLGAGTPKQFVRLGDRLILEHSLATFSDSDLIDEVIVVTEPTHRDRVASIVEEGRHHKVSAIVDGGRTRLDSTAAAVACLADREGVVLVHDAARPFLPESTIAALINALTSYDAVATVVETADTIVVLDNERRSIVETLDRESLRRLQTPQGFRLDVLRHAMELASLDPAVQATDDFSLVRRFAPEATTTFVQGDLRTIKITTPEDLVVAEAFLSAWDAGKF